MAKRTKNVLNFFKHRHDLVLRRLIEVGVDAERGLCILVSEALGDGDGGHARLDEHGGVGVAQIVDANALEAGLLCVAGEQAGGS